MKKSVIVLLLLTSNLLAFAQHYEANWQSLNTRKIPAWFHQDKFGIFIHWGLYSVPSYAPVIPNSGYSYAEWYWRRIRRDNNGGKEENEQSRNMFTAFHDKNYGDDFKYEQFEPMFKAEMFDPSEWADILKRSGAKYVVLTSKHHEGYCLWNSAEADRDWQRPWNAVTGTPHRDLLGDLSEAVRAQGLKMGYYYSLYEWFNPLWLTDKHKYVTEHMIPQFKDLVTKYKPSVIFSDGEWELPDTAWQSPQLLAWLFNDSPVKNEVVVNDRWGSNTRGENKGCMYTTSEYGSGMNSNIIWEENQGIGHSYGYNRNEQLDDYKSSYDLILMLCDNVSRGGNLLLDIGPTADGRIPVIMQQRLIDMGNWLKINGDAIYETESYKQPYQWSNGIKPNTKDASFMAGYSMAKIIVPKKDSAYVECLFTKKDKNLYCIIPAYKTQFTLKNIKLPANAKATVLGSLDKCEWKQQGKDVELNLSAIKPGDISSSGILVVKLAGALD